MPDAPRRIDAPNPLQRLCAHPKTLMPSTRLYYALVLHCAALCALASPSARAQSPFTSLGKHALSQTLPNYVTYGGRMLANLRSTTSDVLVSDGTRAGTRTTGLGAAALLGFRVVGDRLVLFGRSSQDLQATVLDDKLATKLRATLRGANVIGPTVRDAIFIGATPNASRAILYHFSPFSGTYSYLFHRTPRGGGGWSSSLGRFAGRGAFCFVMDEVVGNQRLQFLYASNGTPAGTRPIDETRARGGARLPIVRPEGIYYIEGGRRIMWTDGSRVRSFMTPPSSVGIISEFVAGERFWFSALSTSNPRNQEIYIVEAGSARRVSTSLGGATNVLSLTPVGDRVYFSANVRSGATGRDLWVSDGTEAGTRPVDSRPQAQRDARNPRAMASDARRGCALVRDKLLFFTGTFAANSELFAYRPPHAFSVRVGESCGARSGTPDLFASTPKLGSTLRLTTKGKAYGVSVAAIGSPSHPGTRIAGACVLRIDLGAPIVVVDAWTTSTRNTDVVLPNDTRLNGTSLHAQVLQFEQAGPRRVATSNAVHLRLGR